MADKVSKERVAKALEFLTSDHERAKADGKESCADKSKKSC